MHKLPFHALLVTVAASVFIPRANAVEPLPFPQVNADTWVLIEVWPEMSETTLSAYFMDVSALRNHNLCVATVRALDRDAASLAKAQGRSSTSYRQCLSIDDAIENGYVRAR